MKKLLLNFLKCGIFGWCLEILFTGANALRKRDLTLIGKTSFWMFPIYGAGCLLEPISRLLKNFHWILRGFLYMCTIFTAEYCTGRWLIKRGLCPWDYSKAKWNIKSVVRLDYAPCWFIVGLLYEKLLSR
ncbi:MAG: hypothetical protein PUB13_08715 [Lachnospiraceae bacterium]|nr:hypothetical protein [Lachnospiraceae bacterium]